MAKALAKTRKRYTPLDLAYSRSVSGALNQTYDANYQTYDPDRGLVPLEILFTVRATDPKSVIAPGIINSKLTDIRWYENIVDDAHNILDSNTAYIIDRNGTTDSRGKLTVRKNTPLDGVVLIFTAKYTDPRNGKVVNVTASLSLGVTISTDEPLRVKPGYPFGQVVDPTERRDIIEIDNPLFVGDHEYEGSIYRWQKKAGSNYMTIAEGESGITGTFSDKLKIPCPAVGKRMDIRCIADALPDLTGVNLISKAMISDDWNAIKAGTSIPGEDADGKYFKIYNKALRVAFGDYEENDIFSNKIKYKPNQRYVLSTSMKSLSPEIVGNVINLKVYYTDGSINAISCSGSNSEKTMLKLITKAGYSISKIGMSYTNIGYVSIYDIQLVEYFGGSNLVRGGAYARIPASGVASGNEFKKFYMNKEMAALLTVGTRVTLSIEEVKVLAGNPTLLSFNIYDGVNMSTGEGFPLSTLQVTREIKNNAGATSTPYIGIYGGVFNNMVGNAVELRGVMLVIGDNAYKYSPAEGEFIPALADGAPRPENPSARAITTDHVLSTQYPLPKLEVVAPAEILDETSLFEASVVMRSNRGDIVKPELYWGFPWKDKTGAIFARGSKVFINEDQFDEDVLDYSVEAIEGLEEAKWAANFNGIDQYLRYPGVIDNTTPVKNKTYEIVFRCNQLPPRDFSTIYLHVRNDSSYAHRVQLNVLPDGKIRVMAIKNDDITDFTQQYYVSDKSIITGKIYKLVIRFDNDGILTNMKINGIEEIFTMTQGGGGIAGGSYLYINYPTNPSAITVLDFKYVHRDTELLCYYDFQPLNGDRANMLKGKKADGTLSGSYTITPFNVPNIDDIDPENGFFVTI